MAAIKSAVSQSTRKWSRRTALASAIVFLAATGTSMGANVITNGSFEIPLFSGTTVQQVHESLVPGWETTATNNLIEIWANGNNNVFAADATQHAELNATQVSTLYQDVSGIPANAVVGYSFAHRGRLGVDTLDLRISDLGTDNAPGGVGPAADTILFLQQFSTNDLAWVQYSAPTIGSFTLGNDMRFEFVSVSAAGGNPAIGNFLDNVSFGVGVPEPTSFAVISCALAVCAACRRPFRRCY
jgi:hypothetical protein